MQFKPVTSAKFALIATLSFAPVVSSGVQPRERLHREFYPNGKVKYEAMVDGKGGSRITKWFDEDGIPKEGSEKNGLFERTYRCGVVVRMKEFYPNGNMKSEGVVTNNTVLIQCEYDESGQPKNGIDKKTFSNGNYVESTYHNGKKDGIERRYEQESLLVQKVWIDGEREYEKVLNTNGVVSRVVWYRDGKQMTRKDYHDNGVLDCIRTTETGVEKFGRYHDGRLSIQYTGRHYIAFREDGSVREFGAYDKNDKRHGIQSVFGDTGHLRRELMWSHGRLDGTNRSFYDNGRLKCEAVCSGDLFLRGTRYAEDGSITDEKLSKVGFAGEFGLFHWLRETEPSTETKTGEQPPERDK
jgi:antitoxin component YwqK of YwqJK toxin-antitoxin module